MDNYIVTNYGINYAFVGSQNDYWPIKEEDKDKHFVTAEEFVFGNKNQIIPIFSFEIMRRDFLILWKDDHIDNIENSSYMREMLKQGVNIYGAKNNEEAINIIKLKKRNKIKFITNCGPDLSGKKLIEKIRNEFHYNFICLVFTSRITHLNWVKDMPNVILTTDDFKFREYVEMKMTQKNFLNFIKDLEQTYHTKFNIKENELLKYPDFINDIDHPSPAEKEKLLNPQPLQESETYQPSRFSCLIA